MGSFRDQPTNPNLNWPVPRLLTGVARPPAWIPSSESLLLQEVSERRYSGFDEAEEGLDLLRYVPQTAQKQKIKNSILAHLLFRCALN